MKTVLVALLLVGGLAAVWLFRETGSDSTTVRTAGSFGERESTGRFRSRGPLRRPDVRSFPTNFDEIQVRYDLLMAEPPTSLLEGWLQAHAEGQRRLASLTQAALVQQLQDGRDEGVYQSMREVLASQVTRREDTMSIISLIADAATPHALSILLEQATGNQEEGIQEFAMHFIARIGDTRWGAQFHSELSSPLEEAWQNAPDDEALVHALGSGLATVGAPSGVRTLMEAIAGAGETVEEVKNDVRGAVALSVMREIRNPEAVRELQLWLEVDFDRLDAAPFLASGSALSAMGRVEATGALLTWAQDAPDEAAVLAEEWFLEVRDEKSADAVQDALADEAFFRSDIVRESIRKSLVAATTLSVG